MRGLWKLVGMSLLIMGLLVFVSCERSTVSNTINSPKVNNTLSGKIGISPKEVTGVNLTSGSGSGKPWFFNLHPEDVNYDIGDADAAFDRIIELGGKGVRTDICWYDVEPSRDNYDISKVNFYKQYFAHAASKGLSCMVVLGGWSRTPQWAKDLYDSNPTEFCQEFLEYSKYISSQVADYVYYYQIWNEANHPINETHIPKENDWVVMWYGGKGVKEGDPTSLRLVNVYCDVGGGSDWGFDTVRYWFDHLANYEDVIDMVGIDHYPGTWDLPGDGSNWAPLDSLFSFMQDYNKKGCICETGFSTWCWWQADEHDQENWVHIALPVISNKVKGNSDFLLCNWYELQDKDSNGGGWVEYHFGIYHTDWTKKLAWDDLRDEIATF